MSGRHAGIVIPLFSIRSSQSWGIGELGDIVPLAAWLHEAGVTRLMLLPLGTMKRGETSPYSAASTMAIDPIYISMASVADFARAGGVDKLSAEAREALARAQRSTTVPHDAVRRAKSEALALAFDSFMAEDWEPRTPRAADFAAYAGREQSWLDDYALFESLTETMPERSWRDWPAPLRDRDPQALDQARGERRRDILYQQYCQWVAEAQWQAARAQASTAGVSVVGDLPFVAGMDSAEVWARAEEFMLDISVGVPPMRLAPPGRIGACRCIGGTTSRSTGTSGCANGRAGWRACTTAFASTM